MPRKRKSGKKPPARPPETSDGTSWVELVLIAMLLGTGSALVRLIFDEHAAACQLTLRNANTPSGMDLATFPPPPGREYEGSRPGPHSCRFFEEVSERCQEDLLVWSVFTEKDRVRYAEQLLRQRRAANSAAVEYDSLFAASELLFDLNSAQRSLFYDLKENAVGHVKWMEAFRIAAQEGIGACNEHTMHAVLQYVQRNGRHAADRLELIVLGEDGEFDGEPVSNHIFLHIRPYGEVARPEGEVDKSLSFLDGQIVDLWNNGLSMSADEAREKHPSLYGSKHGFGRVRLLHMQTQVSPRVNELPTELANLLRSAYSYKPDKWLCGQGKSISERSKADQRAMRDFYDRKVRASKYGKRASVRVRR